MIIVAVFYSLLRTPHIRVVSQTLSPVNLHLFSLLPLQLAPPPICFFKDASFGARESALRKAIKVFGCGEWSFGGIEDVGASGDDG